MLAVPRPITKLTDEQRRLLDVAVRAANEKHDAKRLAGELEYAAWQRIVEARKAGVPDDLLCRETRFSRATLNRLFGKRPDAGEGEPVAEN